MQRSIASLGVLAGLIGASGVALAAAVTHSGGGEIGQTAAYFLIFHATALLGLTANARAAAAEAGFARALLVSGAILGLGAIIFSADLANRQFTAARLFPLAAPLGGALMLIGWLAIAAVFVFGASKRRA